MSLFHRHTSEPVAVTHRGGNLMAATCTDILWRCPCGNLRTQTLIGKWELADVRGEPNAPQPIRKAAAS